MKKIFTICLFAFLGTTQVNAQCVEQNLSSMYGFSISPLKRMGQSITASCSGAMNDFKIIADPSANIDGNLKIYEGDGESGLLLKDISFTNISNSGMITINFPSALIISQGMVYTFIFSESNIPDLSFPMHLFNPYPYGRIFIQIPNSNAISPNINGDLLFIASINSSCTSTSSTTNTNICPSALPYSWNGLTFNTAGSQTKTLTNAAGCDSIATLNLSVISGLPAITGSSAICVGGSVALSNTQAGGVWSSLNNRATVNASGEVTGANAGSALIAYKLTTGGCNITTTTSVIVNAIPNVPSIGYAAGTVNPQRGAPSGSFCANRTFTVVGSPAGGAWSSTGVLNVTTPAGVVSTGAIAGAGTLKYTYTSAAGCSNSRTMAGNVVVCAARGVNTVDGEGIVASNDFTIYPNPAKTFISLNVETLIGKGSIVITDLYGKQVKTQSLSMGTNTIDVSKLSKGMYFVSTITSEGKTTKKLVVE